MMSCNYQSFARLNNI